jgi:hypothetical protein
MKHADILAVLTAHGVGGRELADIEAHLFKRRANTTTECLACRSKVLPGDFACGRCSAEKAARESRFWANAFDRNGGGEGREIEAKPDPSKFSSPAQGKVTYAPLSVWEVAVEVKEKMVTADGFFTRRVFRLVEGSSPEEAKSNAKVLTGFNAVSVRLAAEATCKDRPAFKALREVAVKPTAPAERYEFYVRIGSVQRVVVATFGYEAVAMVKAIHGLEDSPTHFVQRFCRTTDDFTDVKAERKAWMCEATA